MLALFCPVCFSLLLLSSRRFFCRWLQIFAIHCEVLFCSYAIIAAIADIRTTIIATTVSGYASLNITLVEYQ